jgi:hypothetical protein
MATREDEVTVRTQLAELHAEQRAQRERLESRHADSIRRFDAHTSEDARRFDKLDVVLDEMRGEFKAVHKSLAALATREAVSGARGTWTAAALVGALSFLGTVAVAVAEHLWR